MGAMVLRGHVVQEIAKFKVFVNRPTGHFGQALASGTAHDPSALVASGFESFKKLPGLQQKMRFPGGSVVTA